MAMPYVIAPCSRGPSDRWESEGGRITILPGCGPYFIRVRDFDCFIAMTDWFYDSQRVRARCRRRRCLFECILVQVGIGKIRKPSSLVEEEN